MGQTLPPAYLCTATETETYVSEQYRNETVVTLPPHPLKKYSRKGNKLHTRKNKWKKGKDRKLLKILQDFVDDFITA